MTLAIFAKLWYCLESVQEILEANPQYQNCK